MPRGVYPRKARNASSERPQAASGRGVPSLKHARRANHAPAPAPVAPPAPGPVVRSVEVSEETYHWLAATSRAVDCSPVELLDHVLRQYLKATLGGGLS